MLTMVPEFQKLVGDRERLVEQPAWVIAQVDDQPLQLAVSVALHLSNGCFNAVRHLLVEADDAQVADIPFKPPAQWLDGDHRPGNHHVEWRILFPLDAKLDPAAGFAPHRVHRVAQAHPLQRLAVDGGNYITRLQAGPVGGRSLDRRDHFDPAFLLGDLYAEAAELPRGDHL